MAGASRAVRTPLLFIGNNEYAVDFSALGRRRQLDGGELWLYVVRPVGPFGLLRLAVRLALGLPDIHHDLTVVKADTAIIEAKRQVLVALDGELVLTQSPLRYAIRPLALAVLAPDQA